ncbi:MAG: hypothetical protein ABIH25_03555 [Candidatus Woesearchaeota archaeon]
MLEEQLQKIKSGYRASFELLGSLTEPDKEHHDPRILIKRSDAFSSDIDVWEAIGYLSGVVCSFAKHPIKTYRIWRSGENKWQQ